MRLKNLLAILGIVVPFAATAEVYRYTDKNGVVHYTDKAPTRDAKPVVLPPVQVIGPISVPPDTAGDAPQTGGPAPPTLSIVSPTADETFRNNDRRLSVSVSVDVPLPEGHGLLYLLDGSAQNSVATRQFSYVLEGVERGEHLVSVAMVDASGREVTRASPVIVHMKPPTAPRPPPPTPRQPAK